MKTAIRSTCLVMALICILFCVTACKSTVPDALKDEPRGTRIPFHTDVLSSYSCTPDISNGDSLVIHFNAEGFEGADYVNCTIEVTFTCTLLYEDMSEESIKRTFTVELPFSGTIDATETVECNKTIHNVYDESYTINKVTGTLIKK